MPSVSATPVSGGYLVEADVYSVVVKAAGITEMYLEGSDDPSVDILSGGGISLCSAYRTVINKAYDLQHAGAVTLDEEADGRVVIKCTGDMWPTDGSDADRGDATFYVTCYPNRLAIWQQINVTAVAGASWNGRIANISWASGATEAAWKYAKGTDAFTDRTPGATRAEVATNSATWGLMWGFTPDAAVYTVSATVYGDANWSGADLDDRDNGTLFLSILEQDAITAGTAYTSAIAVDFLPLSEGSWDVTEARRRRTIFLAPDDLNGNDGEVVVGTRKTGHVFDPDGDSFAQGFAAWTVNSSANRAEVYIARDLDWAAYSYRYDPTFQVYGVSEGYALEYVKRSANGTDWTTLADGVDFQEAAIGTAYGGLQDRFVQIFDAAIGAVYYDMQWAEAAPAVSQGTQVLAGRYGLTQLVEGGVAAGVYGFTSNQGVGIAAGVYAVPTLSQGVQTARGKYLVGYDRILARAAGRYGFAGRDLAAVGRALSRRGGGRRVRALRWSRRGRGPRGHAVRDLRKPASHDAGLGPRPRLRLPPRPAKRLRPRLPQHRDNALPDRRRGRARRDASVRADVRGRGRRVRRDCRHRPLRLHRGRRRRRDAVARLGHRGRRPRSRHRRADGRGDGEGRRHGQALVDLEPVCRRRRRPRPRAHPPRGDPAVDSANTTAVAVEADTGGPAAVSPASLFENQGAEP